MTNKPEKILYLSSTHWDREWYKTFQAFRFRLVDRLNEIINILKNDPDFSVFILDGQTIILDDFARIEPERIKELRTLIKTGRIAVGPWYTMPDEFLVSGESLINNLLKGHSTAVKYSAQRVMKYGYVCDIFGHIAQMPQILNGFEIYGALLGRGTNNHSCESHFIWESPDGSRCLAFKVPEEHGYGTFWYDVIMDYTTGKDTCKENIIKRACQYIDNECARSPVPYVFLMDGMDHEAIHEAAPWICSELEKIYKCPVVIDSPDKLLPGLSSYEKHMPVKKGELIETAKELCEHNKLISGTLSSRYDIKKENDICQNLYEKWVSPLMAMANIKERRIQPSYYDLAYTYILKNHAHDSICGCSVDEVHRDMHYRYNQAKYIGSELIDYAISSLYDIEPDKKSHSNIRLTVCNPLPYQFHDTVVLHVGFTPDYPQKYDEQIPSEKINSFKIFDIAGNEVAYSILSIKNNSYINRPRDLYARAVDLYEIAFCAGIPALEASEYIIAPSSTPARYLGTLCADDLCAENDNLQLKINCDGTINIKDKNTLEEFNNLHSFIDDSEAGDGWFHYAGVSDRVIFSQGAGTIIEKIHNNPEICSFKITKLLDVPSKMSYNRQYTRRCEDAAVLKITSIISLTKTSKWIDIVTKVDNTAQDHRLRLCLKTGIDSGTYYANQAFCFVQRKTGINKATSSWKEPEKAEKAFESIVFKRKSSGNGIAFISKGGLHECAALDDKKGSLIITLFRSFSKTFLTDGQPDGQLNSSLTFNYCIMPFGSDMTLGKITQYKDVYTSGIKAYCSSVNDNYKPQLKHCGFSLESDDIALSIIKTPEDLSLKQVIVRLVNYNSNASTARLHCPFDIQQAYCVNLLEEILFPVEFRNRILDCCLKPYEIKTYRICFEIL